MRETKKKNDKSLWAITTEGRRESNEPIKLIIQSKYMKLTWGARKRMQASHDSVVLNCCDWLRKWRQFLEPETGG